jgi:hypothetical protein
MREERDDEQRDERAVTGHFGFAIARPRHQHRAEHGRAAARLVRWKMHDEHDLEPAFTGPTLRLRRTAHTRAHAIHL